MNEQIEWTTVRVVYTDGTTQTFRACFGPLAPGVVQSWDTDNYLALALDGTGKHMTALNLDEMRRITFVPDSEPEPEDSRG